MAYHDYGHYKTRWSPDQEEEKKKTENPRVQVISPQKKLHDIQQIINSLPDKHLTTVELSEAIQRILNGEE